MQFKSRQIFGSDIDGLKDIILQIFNSFMWYSQLLEIQPVCFAASGLHLRISASQKPQLLGTDPLWECCSAIAFLNPRETEVVKGCRALPSLLSKPGQNINISIEERNTLSEFLQ